MNISIKRVLYTMSKDDSLKVGYLIGKYDGDNRTLLDENLNAVPKITCNGKEYTLYDMQPDFRNKFNIEIDI